MPVKVTIIVLTYNHEKYIGQAVQSILDQKVNFPIQIVVADDGSQDKTINIVSTLKENNVEKISILQHDNNQGVLKNILRIIPTIESEYFAILDGDDYWDNSLKLQHQVEFLEQNSNYNGIFHDAQITHVDTAERVLFNQKKYYSQSYHFKEIISPSDMLDRKIILPSSSALLRTSAFKQVNLELLNDNYSLLWKLTCFLIKHSKFYFINEPWSVYHNHGKGISKSNNQKFHFSHIHFLKGLLKDDYYGFYAYEIYRAIANEYQILLESKEPIKGYSKKKLLQKYIGCELRKLWYYRKRIKNED